MWVYKDSKVSIEIGKARMHHKTLHAFNVKRIFCAF